MATSSLRAGAPRESSVDVALLILRLRSGVLLLMHGLSKLPPPPAFIVDVVSKAGLPAVLAYGVYIGEIVAPILLIVGIWTRLAAFVIVINMIVAVGSGADATPVRDGQVRRLRARVEAFYLFAALALALTGAGRYSVGGRYGPFN